MQPPAAVNALGEPSATWRENYEAAARWFLEIAWAARDDLDRPGLGEWSVRELIGHTGRAFSTVVDYLAAGATEPVKITGAPDYFRAARSADPEAIAARGREAGAALGRDPTTALSALASAAIATLATAPDHALLESPFGAMTLAEYLPTRTFELTVHTCDLATATGRAPTPPPGLAASAWALVGALAGDETGGLLLALTGRTTLAPGFSVLAASQTA